MASRIGRECSSLIKTVLMIKVQSQSPMLLGYFCCSDRWGNPPRFTLASHARYSPTATPLARRRIEFSFSKFSNECAETAVSLLIESLSAATHFVCTRRHGYSGVYRRRQVPLRSAHARVIIIQHHITFPFTDDRGILDLSDRWAATRGTLSRADSRL